MSVPAREPSRCDVSLRRCGAEGDTRLRDWRHQRCVRTLLASDPGYDGLYHWAPDGTALAFISGRNGFDALYRINPDGSDLRRLTSTPSLNPAWSP